MDGLIVHDVRNANGSIHFRVVAVASIMMRRGRAVKHLVKCLLPVVEQRMERNSQDYKQAIVYALYDLCKYPKYIEALREEMTLRFKENETGDPFERMFLLDSFLKESARFSPSDSISLRRKAIGPYTFTDGLSLKVGDVACIPMRAIMSDERNYPNVMVSDGYRFEDSKRGSVAKLTDVEAKFPIWGYGRRAW
ncbi:hypothetical protein OEA41_001772 [Lepraria neglecta]|uniref:Cytochrome P450 n=1 Tax=Lepraria neglecta TaxID=209136 RepID=A0AAE0DLT0_9LECA|nr:hypothetical protein OEA41_001772 [Lepraria neglecta]